MNGLAQVVVGTEFQPDDAVDVVPARGEHQYRRCVRRAEFAQHIEAADARQHHIQNHDLEFVDRKFGQRVAAVMHAPDLEMLGAQVFAEHLAQLAVVVDEQDAGVARGRRIRGWCG